MVYSYFRAFGDVARFSWLQAPLQLKEEKFRTPIPTFLRLWRPETTAQRSFRREGGFKTEMPRLAFMWGTRSKWRSIVSREALKYINAAYCGLFGASLGNERFVLKKQQGSKFKDKNSGP